MSAERPDKRSAGSDGRRHLELVSAGTRAQA